MMRWLAGAFIVAHGLVTAGIWSAPAKADAPFQATHSWLLGDVRGLATAVAIAAALGFALGHLVIMSGNLPGPVAATPPPGGLKLLFRSDVLMWLAKVAARPALMRLVGGVPRDFAFTAEQRTTVTTIIDSIFP